MLLRPCQRVNEQHEQKASVDPDVVVPTGPIASVYVLLIAQILGTCGRTGIPVDTNLEACTSLQIFAVAKMRVITV